MAKIQEKTRCPEETPGGKLTCMKKANHPDAHESPKGIRWNHPKGRPYGLRKPKGGN
jgi:hypothetical protein